METNVTVILGGSWVNKFDRINWRGEIEQMCQKKKFEKLRGEVGLWLVGEYKAKKLNQEYRRRSYVPQVLTFPTKNREPDMDGIFRVGDVVICGPLLIKEAKCNKIDVKLVAREWLEHGFSNLEF
ncbi:MAG: rRNA maturation RNAse YbeY [Candidatus Shapirobacteria bacterium]